MKTDLSKFNIGKYKNGGKLRVVIWFFINYYVFNSAFPWPCKWKVALLRIFGATVGNGVVIKTKVRIKNPWRLSIGDHTWIGESVWIDNLEDIIIGRNVCLSQDSMLLTGNHDYTRTDFPYRLAGIHLEDGVWIGAKSVVCPGVVCRNHSILTVNSVATRELDEWKIYSGNPAAFVRERKFKCSA
jgi:putative colanic acid biosynthesis acetyltransferase WcaF